jgi:hypothetical protein
MHIKNIWDITANNFLSINEFQMKNYGEAGDLDYIIFNRSVKVDDNKNVIPFIKKLDWLISEDDFVDRRELVILDFKKLYSNYERNEHIIRLEIPAHKNPQHNHPNKRKTVCFSAEADFCKRYKLPKN